MAFNIIKMRPMTRSASFDRASIDTDKRTVNLSFASAEPVKRWFGQEVLSFEPGDCDLSRLENGAALLLNHDTNNQIGVVEKAWIENGRGMATVRFSKAPEAQQIFDDVADGIRTKVSVGYNVNAAREIAKEGDDSTFLISSWQPYEISIVSVPADDSVGVGRAANGTETEIKVELLTPMNRTLLDAAAGVVAQSGGGGAAAVVPPVVSVTTVSDRNKESGEILAVAARCKIPMADAQRFISEGKSAADFNRHVIENHYRATPIDTAPDFSTRDAQNAIKRYSVRRLILAGIPDSGVKLDGAEAEVHAELRRGAHQAPKGFLIPEVILQRMFVPDGDMRALSVTSFAGGQALVGTQTLGGQYIELLRNRPVIDRLGVRRLGGLVGNVAIPRGTGGATAYWLPASGAATKTDQTFGQLGLTPHRLVAATAFEKDLVMQASLDVEGVVREDLQLVSAIEIDRAAMLGTGNAGQPQGVVTVASATDVTFGGAATYGKFVDFETNVATGNALMGNPAYVISPATRGKTKVVTKIASSQYSNFIFEAQQGMFPGDGVINSYPAIVTNQVGAAAAVANQVIFGNWNDMFFASWAGLDLVVDPYSLAENGQIKVVLTQWCDVGIRHTASFCKSTDSGAQ